MTNNGAVKSNSADDYVEIHEETNIFKARAKLEKVRNVDLDIKQIERAIFIREWASMSLSGVGLGYGKSILNFDGHGEPPLTVEQFTEINDAVESLPLVNIVVLKSVYKFKNTVKQIVERTGMSKRKVDECHKQALNLLYGKLCC